MDTLAPPKAFRSRKLLDQARGRPCMVQVAAVCCGDPATVVAAHSNMALHGRGFAHKAHDWATTWACHKCHAWLDYGNAPRAERELAFYRGMSRTFEALFAEGLVKVS